MKIDRNILYSTNTDHLVSFLSILFDTEGIPLKDGFDFKSLQILVKEGQVSHLTLPLYECRVDSYEELSALKRRIELIEHKIGKSNTKNFGAILESQDEFYLIITDPDGRKWKMRNLKN